MSIDSTWLRCPNCFQSLESVDERVLGCDTGHRFDLTKHGTVTLLPPRAPSLTGDSREMLEARAELLESGVYEPIARALEDGAAANLHLEGSAPRIVDLACGTGYYSGRLSARFDAANLLLVDRSPTAVRMARRGNPHATGVVLDLWRPLPIRDAVADLSINVFAPRNPDEFARITRAGGLLAVVVPTDRHLAELRSSGAMLDIPSGKAEQVTTQLSSAGFDPVTSTTLDYVAELDEAQCAALVGMGPAAHHVRPSDQATAPSPGVGSGAGITAVTVSVDVLLFRRR